MADLFSNPDMARGYVMCRPAVHTPILARAKHFVPRTCRRALDVGCGCGLSTRALEGFADVLIGLEKVMLMTQTAPTVMPGAHFVVGVAEALPFASGALDLITAAGSLNYVDLDLFMAEAARTLSPSGMLIVYDFGQGKHSSTLPGLDAWFAEFERRYPAPAAEVIALDSLVLRHRMPLFRLAAEDSFDVTVSLSRGQYIDYLLTETNIPAAVQRGVDLETIRSWCYDSLPSVWPGPVATVHEISFPAYFVCMTRRTESSRIIEE